VKKPVVVLLIMVPGKRRRALAANLERAGLETLSASNCRGARELLRIRPDIAVAVTDLTLADGNWRDLLEYTIHRDVQTSVVVVSPVGGERLWSEVLWRGAHDLLVEPFEGLEIRRAVESAERAARAAEYGARGAGLLRPPPARLSLGSDQPGSRARA